MARIALDAMGGDFAPQATIAGALLALDNADGHTVQLVGQTATIENQLAELLIEWDERVGVWRFRHFKVVARIIGEDVVGTQGTPVELLAGLIKVKLYPELWAVRTELTELAKLGDPGRNGD